MRSDAGDAPDNKKFVLMARMPEGQSPAQAEALLRLLHCLDGVSVTEILPAACQGNGSDPGLARDLSGYYADCGDTGSVLAVVFVRSALVSVLSTLLQAGCSDLVKKQHICH